MGELIANRRAFYIFFTSSIQPGNKLLGGR
jgi:hypothetical protein